MEDGGNRVGDTGGEEMITKKIKFNKMLSTDERNAMWDTGKVLSEEQEPDGSLTIVCGWEDKIDMLAFLVHFGLARVEVK